MWSSQLRRATILMAGLIAFCIVWSPRAATAQAQEVFILHSPIQPYDPSQPSNVPPVTYTATTNVTGTIDIWEERRIVSSCGGAKCTPLDPGVSPNPRKIQTCPASPCTSAAITYSTGSYIGYAAIVNPSGPSEPSGNDPASPTNFIYFVAGAYPTGAPYSANDPVPVYIRQGDIGKSLDLVFIADYDYCGANATSPCSPTSWGTQFVTHVTELIEKSFFSSQNFARELVRGHRDMWNFYVTYQQGNAEPSCVRTPPPGWNPPDPQIKMIATVNAGAIVHRKPFNDCSGLLIEDSTFSTQPISAQSLNPAGTSPVISVHESAHALFNLADEYNAKAMPGTFLESTWQDHNVFKSYSKCTDNITYELSDPPGTDPRPHMYHPEWPANLSCSEIGTGRYATGWFRSDTNSPNMDVMADTSQTTNTFGLSDKGRYLWRYGECSTTLRC
jgi:hypothetical protein